MRERGGVPEKGMRRHRRRRRLFSLGGLAHEVLSGAFFDFFVGVAADQAVDAADVEDDVAVVAADPPLRQRGARAPPPPPQAEPNRRHHRGTAKKRLRQKPR